MDDTEWPNLPDVITGLRDALNGQKTGPYVRDLSMYMSQLGSVLRTDEGRLPFEVLREYGLATGVFAALSESLGHAAADERAAACLALEYLRDPAAMPGLRPMIDDTDHMVVVRAAEALHSFGEPGALLVPKLIEVLSYPEDDLPCGSDRIGEWPCQHLRMPESHYHAARILSYLGKEAAPAREALLATLASGSGIVRAEAARTLAVLGESPETFLPPLRQAMNDVDSQSPRERVNTAGALAELGEAPESVVPVLMTLGRDEDYTTRVWAIDALGEMGPDAISAVPFLREAIARASEEVAEHAARALWKIEGGKGFEKGGYGIKPYEE